jgi:hypothetical protein
LKYIVVEYGCPRRADVLPVYRPNRLAILRRAWEHIHGFSDTSRYAIAIDSIPKSTNWQRLLAHTVYNPAVPVSAEWRLIGERKSSDILAMVEDGLRHDDDIIQQ